jgi:hypothetical protein
LIYQIHLLTLGEKFCDRVKVGIFPRAFPFHFPNNILRVSYGLILHGKGSGRIGKDHINTF